MAKPKTTGATTSAQGRAREPADGPGQGEEEGQRQGQDWPRGPRRVDRGGLGAIGVTRPILRRPFPAFFPAFSQSFPRRIGWERHPIANTTNELSGRGE